MIMRAIYNEIEPYPCEWTRALIGAGAIASGEVIERGIADVTPAELDGATQFHAFAGIGVWSYALRLAGWPDHAPVWTGSCPCQPFSDAGRKKGFQDARHLWPEWFRLIRECCPPVIFGEQVASADGLAWLDVVSSDLEGAGYAFAAADLCAAGVGAPHRRQRLFFVALANADVARSQGRGVRGNGADQRPAGASGVDGLVVDPAMRGRESFPLQTGGSGGEVREVAVRELGAPSAGPRGLGHADGDHAGRDPGAAAAAEEAITGEGMFPRRLSHRAVAAGATRGFWGDADWIACADGKYRPVEPGSFPLAHGAPARVGRLRAYGNAIVPQVAATFIRAVMDELGMQPGPLPAGHAPLPCGCDVVEVCTCEVRP